jgi:VWFA-related protein
LDFRQVTPINSCGVRPRFFPGRGRIQICGWTQEAFLHAFTYRMRDNKHTVATKSCARTTEVGKHVRYALKVGFIVALAALALKAQQPQGTSPISGVIVFDTSASIGSKLQQSQRVLREFFETANSQDEFALVQSHQRPVLIKSFSSNVDKIQNLTNSTQAQGPSALLDAIYLAMNQMKKARNPRKALLIISDGVDNSSRYTESEIKNAVREADVQIYAIGIYEPVASRARTPEEMAGPGLLSDIAKLTGGRHFAVERAEDSQNIAAQVSMAMRSRQP